MEKPWLAALAAMFLAGLLALLPLAEGAVAQADEATLQGLITEVGDGYFVMADETLGAVRVNLDDAVTVYEGSAARDTLAVGQYVLVAYDGTMTRSQPPQVTARRVGCFSVTGTVTEILAGGYVVEGDPVLDRVIVHMADGFPPVYAGVPITVYYSGVMALSMPPQIGALHIVVPVLTGTVSALADAGFTLTDAAGQRYAVTTDENTRFTVMPSDGAQVNVYYSGALTPEGGTTALQVAPLSQQTAEE